MSSINELKEFIDYAEKNRKYATETAKGRRAALKLFDDELNDDERSSIDLVEERFDRIYQSVFQKNKQTIKASSLETYKTRMRSLIREFKKYGNNPGAFTAWDMTRNRKSTQMSVGAKSPSGQKMTGSHKHDAKNIVEAELVQNPAIERNVFGIVPPLDKDMLEYPFALTNGVATIHLPKNINQKDAERLTNFVKSLVNED